MTSNTPETQAILPVTQADRDAVAAWLAEDYIQPVENFSPVTNGERDDYGLVQAFARHRISHSLPGDVGMREALTEIEHAENVEIARRIARAALTTPPTPHEFVKNLLIPFSSCQVCLAPDSDAIHVAGANEGLGV